jgi:hypothetical protein
MNEAKYKKRNSREQMSRYISGQGASRTQIRRLQCHGCHWQRLYENYLSVILQTDFMEQNNSWRAERRSTGQEISFSLLLQVSCLAYTSTLNMEVIRSSEMYQTVLFRIKTIKLSLQFSVTKSCLYFISFGETKYSVWNILFSSEMLCHVTW